VRQLSFLESGSFWKFISLVVGASTVHDDVINALSAHLLDLIKNHSADNHAIHNQESEPNTTAPTIYTFFLAHDDASPNQPVSAKAIFRGHIQATESTQAATDGKKCSGCESLSCLWYCELALLVDLASAEWRCALIDVQ